MSKTPDRSERRKQRLEIVYRATGELKLDPANARQHSKNQIRKLANSIETFGFNVPVPVDDLPELPASPPVSKIGDLWMLGNHRVLCGSALDAAAFAVLMGDERAATIFTDAPYNVRIDGHASGLGAIHHRPFPMASGEMNKTEFIAFLGQAFRNLAAFSLDGSLHYVCMDWRHLEELLGAGREAYSELKNLCVWV